VRYAIYYENNIIQENIGALSVANNTANNAVTYFWKLLTHAHLMLKYDRNKVAATSD